MYKTNFQQLLFLELKKLWQPLINASTTHERLADFLLSLGWDIEAFSSGGQELTTLFNNLQSFTSSLGIFNSFVESSIPTSLPELAQRLGQLEDIINAAKKFNEGFSNTDPILTQFVGDIARKLFVKYLYDYHNSVYFFLKLINVITESEPNTVVINNVIAYDADREETVDLTKLSAFINNPKDALKSLYWPQGLNTVEQATESGNRIFQLLAGIFHKTNLEVVAGRAATDKPDNLDDATWARLRGLLTLKKRFTYANSIQTQLGITAGILSAAEGGPGVFLKPFGELDINRFFGSWQLKCQIEGGGKPIKITSNGIEALSEVLASNFSARLALTLEPPGTGQYALRIGSSTGSRLEIESVALESFLTKRGATSNYGIIFKIKKGAFVLKPSDGDSFIAKILPPEGTSFKFDFGIGWTKGTGIHFEGTGGLDMQATISHNAGERKYISVDSFQLGIAVSNVGISITTAASGQVKLGPVLLIVEKIGLSSNILYKPDGGNIGIADFGIKFKLPTGIGISVDSDTIKGGGYLSIDSAAYPYAGVANLTFRHKLTLNAIGILQTELPNNQPGYSLLLIITATGFTPIQLGMGFTLNGIGGLVGINRTVDIPYLRTQVQAGNIDSLLFPANVLDNTADVLSRADSSFPAAEGRYVFGLIAKIGWGTPTLITLDAALIIELPAPVRLVLLGVLQTMLPDKDHQLIKLRADFLGVVDFGARKISFDASLTDSRIMQFTLTGDAAFRLYQGDNPVFVLTMGGFHPAFQPPANADLPTLRRLTLALANSGDLKIILTTYLALTSNTLQFGSRMDLFYDLAAGFYLEGFFGFDVLFQFHPFHLDAYIGAGVAIKRKGSTKLGIFLALNVSGPAPWHVVGEASFKVLGFKIRARIERTFGSGAQAQPLETIDVKSLFMQALEDPESWETEEPSTTSPASVVLQAAAGDPATLLIDPGGTLVLRQRLVPLGVVMEKFGNEVPVNGNQFDVKAIEANGMGTGALQPVSDFFAPEQFHRMTDAQKLSSPSFQLMRSGCRISGMAQFGSAAGTRRVVEYEEITIKAEGSVNGGLAGDASAEVASVAACSAAAAKAAPLKPEVYTRLARNSAIGRAYRKQQPSVRAPEPVKWSEDAYVVVNARDLSPVAGLPTSFASEALATQCLKQQLGKNPGLKGELLVVPAYQLETNP